MPQTAEIFINKILDVNYVNQLTLRTLILGKLQRLFHSLRMYSLSPTMTTCLSSSSSKLLARSGMMRLRRPISAEWASANRQTTTWLLRTVIAACSRVYGDSKGKRKRNAFVQRLMVKQPLRCSDMDHCSFTYNHTNLPSPRKRSLDGATICS